MPHQEPPFYLQIVDANGVVIRTRAGRIHEAPLVDAIVSRTLAKGVGIFRTQANVEAKLREAITEAIDSIKVTNPLDVL